MRRFIFPAFSFFILPLVFIFSACKKDDTVFKQSPDTRINETLSRYQAALTGSAAGWNATVQTGQGSIYHFLMRFTDSNRVFMYADINMETATTVRESSYRLKALQTPSLIFDTYSYLHMLADPDASVNGGTYGQGLVSDFEFSLDTLTADSIRLTGRVNSTKLTLKKATQQDLDAWQNGVWAGALAFENINNIQNYFKRVTIGGTIYELRVDLTVRTITLSWVDGSGLLQQFTTPYTFSSSGIVFLNPLTTATGTITGFQVVNWDAATSVLNIKVDGVPTTIAGAAKPLKADVSAPQRWWQYAIDNGGQYWASFNGFHANGVDDAFGIKTLSRYYYLIYWPKFEPGNDLFAPVFINAAGNGLELQYGVASNTPQFMPDGRAVFTLSGTYGMYPATGPAALTRTQLLIPQGYYFIQTGEKSYDMVSATDAKAWINWTFL